MILVVKKKLNRKNIYEPDYDLNQFVIDQIFETYINK